MLKSITLIGFISLNLTLISQTLFSKGFSDGYKIGYCYNQKSGCLTPMVPVAPNCQIGESYDNYLDGYNRGLLTGTNNASISKVRVNSNNNIYQSQKGYVPKFETFNLDFLSYQKGLEQSLNKTDNQSSKYSPEIQKIIDNYTSPEKKQIRKAYIDLIKFKWNNFKKYPTSYPDGIYTCVLICGNSFNEKVDVIVKNNQIEEFRFFDEFNNRYLRVKPKSFELKNYDLEYRMSYSSIISKGLANITYDINSYNKSFTSISEEIYFIDYLTNYNNAQDCINEIKTAYTSLKKLPVVQNGWNIVKALDGVSFCDVRNVFVENGKVTIYKISDGTEMKVNTGGIIINNKTTVSYNFVFPNGESKTSVMELYFF